MVGMGAVVTRPVGDHQLVVGNPARVSGVVCRCGQVVHRGEVVTMAGRVQCPRCGLAYVARDGEVAEAQDQ